MEQSTLYKEWLKVSEGLKAARERLAEARQEYGQAVARVKTETRGCSTLEERRAQASALLAPSYASLNQAKQEVADYEVQEGTSWRAYEHSRGIN